MRIEEAVEYMSKIYLHRILDSYTKDTAKPDQEASRKRIAADKELLADPKNIHQRLNQPGCSLNSKILSKVLLEALLDSEGVSLDESSIFSLVTKFEQSTLEEASNPDIFQFKDKESRKTYRTVLEVALEDDHISEDEMRLLSRLRAHLGLSLRDHILTQANLGKFPKNGNVLHTEKEIKNELDDLQKRGVVFYCNQVKECPLYLIPEEIVPGVKDVICFELSDKAYSLLLNNLNLQTLKRILSNQELPVSGKKDELINRIIKAEIKPSIALETLTSDELYNLCKSLPGIQVSGSKSKRISNIIKHFDCLLYTSPSPRD